MLLVISLLGCAKDADMDGFAGKDDCNDEDPFVYPDAPEVPGDGIDADCAEGDPVPTWYGDWHIEDMTATYSGIQLFVEGTGDGDLSTDGSNATLTVIGTLNPDVVGGEFTVTVNLEGYTSPIPMSQVFSLYAEGDNYEERMHADWECWEEDPGLLCTGEFKALDASLDADVVLVR